MTSATGSSFHDLREEVTCSICLEYFQDPVITECGHNFCRACLAKCWEGSEGEEIACPQCRGKVQRKLIPNRQLANLVEKLRHQEEKRAKERKGVCEKHQEPLKLFCKEDEAPICLVCDRAKEHRDHQVVPMDEVIPQYQDQITKHLERLKEEMAEIMKFKEETEKESQDLLKQTKTEMGKMKAEFRKLHQFLEEQEKFFKAQLEEVEKEVSKKWDERLAELSEALSSLGSFIQEMEEKSRQPPAEFLRDLRGILQSSEKREPFQKPVVFSPQLKWKMWEICDRNASLAGTMKQFRDSLLPGLQLQKAKVNLNPRTAHPVLILSDDCKSVRSEGIWQDLPNYPERFDLRSFVLGHEAFTTGRHYWEVSVGNGGFWAVGVARKSVQRKGQFEMSTHEGIWSVGTLESHLYKKVKQIHQKEMYNASNQKIFSPSQKLKRIWVSVNYGRRQVAFHDAETGSHLYTFSGSSFSGETLLPFFFVAGRASLTITS